MRLRSLVILLGLLAGMGACPFARAAEWIFLPVQPLFQPFVADLRECRCYVLKSFEEDRWNGAVGKVLPIFRLSGDQGTVEWGIRASAFMDLRSHIASFPMQENDWWLSTYFSGGSRVAWRFDYTHVSSHLGDSLFSDEDPIVYSREFFRLFGSTHLGPVRFYLGPGILQHAIPRAKSLFVQTGLEWTSRPIGAGGRLYAAWDFKAKKEYGGVANHTLQAGWQFGDGEMERTVRLGLSYFHGHSEEGQFYKTVESRLSGGVYFDP